MTDVPEMVERVASAIEAAYRNDDDSHAAMVRAARAAIEAMRLPAGASSVPGGMAIEESMFESEDTVFHGAAKCWNAMIDAAIRKQS